MNAKAIILLADHNCLSAYARHRGQLILEGRFDNTTDGYTRFSIYLAERCHHLFSLVVNTPDETYIRESIPRLRGGDRRALIARRVRQHFPESALTTCLSQGSKSADKTQEVLLIAALAQAEKLAPWLDSLSKTQSSCSDIHTVSQLAAPLLKALGDESSSCLLLAQCGTTLRESFLVDGTVVFTRQAQLPDASAPEIADFLLHELSKLQQHLLGQREIDRNSPLSAHILVQDSALKALPADLAALTGIQCRLSGIMEAAQRIGCTVSIPPDDASPLFLQLLSRSKPKHGFREPRLSRQQHLKRVRTRIHATTLALVFSSLLHLDYQLDEAQRMTALIPIQAEMQSQDADRYTGMPDKVRMAMIKLDQQHQAISSLQLRPESSLQLIGQTLDSSPEVELDHLEWQNESAAQDGRKEDSIVLNGHFNLPETSTAREILSRQDDFIESLRKTGSAAVDMIKPAISLNASFPVSAQEDGTKIQARQFALRVRWRQK